MSRWITGYWVIAKLHRKLILLSRFRQRCLTDLYKSEWPVLVCHRHSTAVASISTILVGDLRCFSTSSFFFSLVCNGQVFVFTDLQMLRDVSDTWGKVAGRASLKLLLLLFWCFHFDRLDKIDYTVEFFIFWCLLKFLRVPMFTDCMLACFKNSMPTVASEPENTFYLFYIITLKHCCALQTWLVCYCAESDCKKYEDWAGSNMLLVVVG